MLINRVKDTVMLEIIVWHKEINCFLQQCLLSQQQNFTDIPRLSISNNKSLQFMKYINDIYVVTCDTQYF